MLIDEEILLKTRPHHFLPIGPMCCRLASGIEPVCADEMRILALEAQIAQLEAENLALRCIIECQLNYRVMIVVYPD